MPSYEKFGSEQKSSGELTQLEQQFGVILKKFYLAVIFENGGLQKSAIHLSIYLSIYLSISANF